MNFKAAVFDMDGTLIDSMHIWDHMASGYLEDRGITPPEDIDRRFKTMSVSAAAAYLKNTFGLPETPEGVLRGINDRAARQYLSVEAKPGVFDFLTALKGKGIPMAIATMTDRPEAEAVLRRLSLLPFFDGIATCGEVGAGKNRPDVYDAARAILGSARAETAVFEDAHFAIRCAKAAGFYTVCVRDSSMEARFEESRRIADFCVLDYRALDPETV